MGGGTTSYIRVTDVAEIEVGTYAIAVDKVNSQKYNFANAEASSGNAGVEGTGTTKSDSYTTLPSGAVLYTLAGNNIDGFSIQEKKTGKYLVATAGKGSLSYAESATEKWIFTSAESTGGFYLTGKLGSKMSANSTTASSAIRNYASTGNFYSPIFFFKQTGGSTTTYKTSPNCAITYTATASATENGTIKFSSTEDGTYDQEQLTGLSTGDWIYFSVTPNSGYSIATVTVNDNGTGITSLGDNKYKYQMQSDNVEVSATFSSVPTLSFDANGGTVEPTSTTTSPYELPTPTKTGYNFEGWCENSDLSDNPIAAKTSYTFTESKTLYAKWSAKTYSITLKKGDGTTDGSATATYDNNVLSSYESATRNAGTFKWLLDGYYTAASGGTKVIDKDGNLVAGVSTYTDETGKWIKDADVELTAHWTAVYTITWVTATGSTTTEVTQGDYLVLPDGTPTSCDNETYKTFVGWYDTQHGTAEAPSTSLSGNQATSTTQPTENMTYYAVFSDGTGESQWELVTTMAQIPAGTEVYFASKNEDNTPKVGVTGYNGKSDATYSFNSNDWAPFKVVSVPNNDSIRLCSADTGYVSITDGGFKINNSSLRYSIGTNGYLSRTSGANEYALAYRSTESFYRGYKTTTITKNNYAPAYLWKKSNIATGYISACGPHVGVSGDVRITSAKGVRVDAYTKISVRATNLDKNEHSAAVSIKAESDNPNFKIKRWGTTDDGTANSLSLKTNITAANYEDSLCITYTPTASNTTESATITLTAYRYNGSAVYATNTITVQGHSLPERFVIAAKSETGWVALPNTLGSSSNATVPNAEDISNEVDPSDNPTKLTTAPSNVIYTAAARADAYKNNSQTGLRFTVDGKQFLQASESGTKVWLPTDNSQYMQSWTLRTEDFVNYQARLDSAVAGRYLAYYKDATTERIGHYKATTPIRFLPFDEECTRLLAPANLKVTQVKSTAITLTWDAVTGATGYAYSTDNGTNWTKIGNVLTYTIAGLTAEKAYTIWVKGVVPEGDTEDCSYYGTVPATTADCNDVPYDISYTSDVNSITLTWTMTSATATVQVFSDAEGTTKVGSDYTGKTSPFTITGLTKATTYYVKILAGGSCSSELVEVSTERPQLDVVEWKPDGIDVAINTNEKISVVLENQVTKGTGTGKVAEDLFFSKYFEAKGDLKMLGIFNGTDHNIDLTNIRIWGAKEDASEWKKEGSLSPNNYVNLGKIKQTIISGEEIILFTVGNYFASKIDDYTKSSEYPNGYTQTSHPNNWYLVGIWGTGGKDANGNMGLTFSGAYSLALVDVTDAENPKFLDVIGAGTESAPAHDGIGSSPTCTMDNNNKAFYATKGKDFEGNETTISTNSFLLVRKNTVESGSKAVEYNTTRFKTLGDDYFESEGIEGEWIGKSVCEDVSSTESQIMDSVSCSYFDYVSTFDYSGYYTTYDSLTTVEFEESSRNLDGTVTIPINRMDTLACRGLKIIAADESGNVLTTKEYRVPILITENASTNSTKYFRFSGDTCKTCDVVIRNNATLTKEADGADNDKPQVRDVMVYEGSSLVVPSGTNYTVNSLSLRRREDAVAVVDVVGTLNINSTSDKPVYLDMRITAENWHWFTLPYDCAIADVTWSNGQPAKYRTDWFLMYYDGESRATGVDSGNWKEYTGSTIAAGQGFIIGIKGDGNDKHAFELRFPMAKEVITKDGEDKTVPVYAYGAGKDVRPNHKGWNLVGNPYLNYYQKGNINSFNGLRLGLLEYDAATGWWSVSAKDMGPYIVIPQNFGWSAYKQVLVSSQDLLPFTSYFIQVGKDTGYENGQRCEVQFDKNQRGKSAKAALMTGAELEAEEEPVITGIVLRNAQGEEDETSLVIAEQFGSSYEMGADFFKWFGDYYKYYTLPVLYSIGDDGGKRAFNAVNEAGAKQSIPLGMYAARDGEYTFSLNTRSDLSRVDKVWLYDAESGLYTDLLREDYTFATTRTEGSGRFFLSVVLKEKEITTGASDVRYGDLSLSADKQTLVVRGLPEAAEVWVYDPSGKLLHHEQTRHYERHYAVPQQGTYLVRVESKDGAVTLRGVCR